MIFEMMIAGVTVAFVSSLAFVNNQIKRKRQWELEDSIPPEPEPVIYPFVEMQIGTRCPKCSRPGRNATFKKVQGVNKVVTSAEGPGVPFACNDNNCKAKKRFHLHVKCNTCNANWFMQPADKKD